MPTIGETLREARQKKKISVDVAARAVKVKSEILERIEENDFSGFAAHLYARGIIRLYATYLGLEPETLVQEYNKLHSEAPQKPSEGHTSEEHEQIMERRRSVIVSTVSKTTELTTGGVVGIIVGVVFLGVLIWALSSSRKPDTEPLQPVAPAMTNAVNNTGLAVPPLTLGHETPPFMGETNIISVHTNAVPALEIAPGEQP